LRRKGFFHSTGKLIADNSQNPKEIFDFRVKSAIYLESLIRRQLTIIECRGEQSKNAEKRFYQLFVKSEMNCHLHSHTYTHIGAISRE
jgi:hypothetical protein